jgi:hypothetical protein
LKFWSWSVDGDTFVAEPLAIQRPVRYQLNVWIICEVSLSNIVGSSAGWRKELDCGSSFGRYELLNSLNQGHPRWRVREEISFRLDAASERLKAIREAYPLLLLEWLRPEVVQSAAINWYPPLEITV